MELNSREANALRRLLNRAELKPQEVARLGLARIEAAPGLGAKGLAHVLAWLEHHDCGQGVIDESPQREANRQDRINRRLEQAQHLLEQWGWQVRRPDRDNGTGERA